MPSFRLETCLYNSKIDSHCYSLLKNLSMNCIENFYSSFFFLAYLAFFFPNFFPFPFACPFTFPFPFPPFPFPPLKDLLFRCMILVAFFCLIFRMCSGSFSSDGALALGTDHRFLPPLKCRSCCSLFPLSTKHKL